MKNLLTLLLIAILLVTTVAAGPVQQDAAIPLLDVHTHTDFSSRTQEQYFHEWREAGVVGAVAHTTATVGNFHDLKSRNVIYCGGVGDRIDLKRLEDGLKSQQHRCLKIYLG